MAYSQVLSIAWKMGELGYESASDTTIARIPTLHAICLIRSRYFNLLDVRILCALLMAILLQLRFIRNEPMDRRSLRESSATEDSP